VNHESSTHTIDAVVTNATVVTVNDSHNVIVDGAVGIDDGRITYVGPTVGAPTGRITINAHGAIVLPGLVNTHAHLAMALLRGVADDRDLDGFLGRVLPIEGALVDRDFVLAGSEIALGESLLGGITSTIDMYFCNDAVQEAASVLGATVHNGPVFFEFDGPDHKSFEQRIDEAEGHLSAAAEAKEPLWICPHSTYLLSEPQLVTLADLANRHNARVHVHAAETLAELDQVGARHGGRTPFAVLSDAGLLTDRTVLAHAVHMSDADIEMVTLAGSHIAHNPASNLKLASGLAPIERYINAGINVALGTDGSASANDLDLWIAMRLASYARKAFTKNPALLNASQMVTMATRNGAKAAGTLNDTGSIEIGKYADIVVLRHDSLSLAPSYDPLSTLAYAATRNEVAHVFSRGELVVNHGSLVRVESADILKRAMPQVARVKALL
jgi:5-methylthioadenosine/S-adenosylhomocysteine deaminase